MATQLHHILENFRWRIEATTPTCEIPGKPFRRLDPTKIDEADSQGLERSVMVRLVSGGDDLEVTDHALRSSIFTVVAMVLYWPGRGHDTAQEVIAQDQFDLVQALRDDTKYAGWSDENASGDLGLVARELKSQSVDYSDPEVWMLTQEWLCQVTETA